MNFILCLKIIMKEHLMFNTVQYNSVQYGTLDSVKVAKCILEN